MFLNTNLEMDEVDNHKWSRCIVCSTYTFKRQCYNIFTTTLDKGEMLLSGFLKNVLGCSVLIIIPPEFFLCKSCYTLCSELDYSLARCTELQLTIQSLFKASKANQEAINNDLEQVIVKTELEEDEEFYSGQDEDQEEHCEEANLNGETVEKIQEYSETQLNGEISASVVESSQVIEDGIFWAQNQEVFYEEVFPFDPTNEERVVKVEAGSPLLVTAAGDEMTQLDVKDEEPLSTQVQICHLEEEVEEDNSDQYKLGLVWFCKPCKMNFRSLESIKRHKKRDSCKSHCKNLGIKSAYEFKNYTVKLKKKNKVFFCNYCTFEAPTSASMDNHVLRHKSDPPMMCDICGRRFKTPSTFKRHQRVHDESRPYACKICTFRSETELTLRIHQRMHDNQKKYTCSKCDYNSFKKMSYQNHLRTHTGERPYSCPDCPYRAKDSSTLLRHRRTHGGLKSYHCTICDYKALQKNSLRRHMMIHTGEKPHTCPHCEYSSTMRHNLADHIASKHSTEKPFACGLCSYKTKAKRLLKYHMRIHSGEKPFACTICGYRVRHRGGLNYHMRTRHPPDGKPKKVIVKFVHFPEENIEFSDEEEDEYEIVTD